MFKKKETLLQNIAFMALMAAINLVITLLMTYVPFIMPFAIIFLPFLSVVVTLFCKKKYFPLYALTTIGLCLLCTMANITDTLFFVIPAVLSGFIFGILVNYKFPKLFLILAPTFINLTFTYLSIPFIELIYGFNYIDKILTVFSLDQFQYINEIMPSIIFLFSLIQSLFTFAIIKNELPKFNVSIEQSDKSDLIYLLINLILVILIASFSVYRIDVSYICTMIFILITVNLIVENYRNNALNIIVLVLSSTIGFLAFGLTFNSLGIYSLLLINIGFLLINTLVIFNKYLFKSPKDYKIETDN